MLDTSSHTSASPIQDRFAAAFGDQVSVETPLAASGMGVRLSGIDLTKPLTPEQVALLLDTGVCYMDFGTDVSVARRLLMQGRWSEAVPVISFVALPLLVNAILSSSLGQGLVEAVLSLSFLKPALDAFRIATSSPERLQRRRGVYSFIDVYAMMRIVWGL